MGSERTLAAGLIPQWMKQKIDTRLELDDPVAFSPPDDAFFYLRYKILEEKTSTKSRDLGYRPISQVLQQQNITSMNQPQPEMVPNFAQHTVPCQQYIGGIKTDISKKQVKSTGIDDGFKGSGAACGTSIIQVANQMVSSRSLHNQEEAVCICDLPSSGVVVPPRVRRGSKSLPSSPDGSPRSKRKLNRYFTGAFSDKHQTGWIMAGLLGSRDALSKSTSTIIVEEEPSSLRESRAQSKVDVNNVNMEETEPIPIKREESIAFRPKPSVLREMNVWSPTSM